MNTPAFITSAGSVLHNGLSTITGRNVTPRTTSPVQPRSVPLFRMSVSGRKFIVGGNWKCNLDKTSIQALVENFNQGGALDMNNVEVVVAPPAVYLDSTRKQLRSDFAVSAQNVWIGKGGAYTGEIDATMVKDLNCDWTILGHSERRHHPVLKESDQTIAIKAKYATDNGLKVIYCIGELLEEREAGMTVEVCQRQLQALKLGGADWDQLVIAYEPVWAIGTGKVATPEQAEEVHAAIRVWLGRNVDKDVADKMRILYGGSVSPGNCQELAKKKNIDGFLVGGASLKPTFLQIVDSYKTALAATV